MRSALLSSVSYGALEHGIRAAERDRITRIVDARAAEKSPASAARIELRMLRSGDTIQITHRAYLAIGLYRFAAILILTALRGAVTRKEHP